MQFDGRSYSCPVNINSAFTAQIDIFEITAGTGKPLVLLGWDLMQTSEVGDAQEEVLTLLLKRAVGSVTSGSGGQTPSFTPDQPNDVATGATIETGNTTKLVVGSGTITNVKYFGWQIRQSHLYMPIPEARIVVAAGDKLVLELVTTPADSIAGIVGSIDIGELV